MPFFQLSRKTFLAAGLLALLVGTTDTTKAKSLYVNINLNAGSPISAYDIQPAPSYLVFQETSLPTRYGGVGLAIDTDSEILFVTFEGSGTLDIVDAKTLAILGQVTAPNATNLAGIVVDQENQKVYAVDRNTDHLYVYSWDPLTKTLTNDITGSPPYIQLPGISATGSHGSGLHGIALDEVNDLLYVCDVTNNVKVFNTADWSSAFSVPASQPAMSVAVDVDNGLVYTGNAYGPYGSTGELCQYDLNSLTEAKINIQSLTGFTSDNVVGLAVDPLTSLLYLTTGNQGSGGSDQIMVFDASLTNLFASGDIGDPTGIVVPGKDISFNPLNLSKDDGLNIDLEECAGVGQELTYTISFDNTANADPVDNVVITDTLPIETIFVSATGGGIYDSLTHSVSWNVGNLPAGDPGDFYELVVKIDPLLAVPGLTFTNSCTIISDQTPPTTQNEETLVCPNQPPTADAGDDQTLECKGGGAEVTLDGSGSTDPDSTPGTNDDIVSFRWYLDFGTVNEEFIGEGETLPYTFALGQHIVTLVVEDSFGVLDDDSVTITVQDTTAPTVACSVAQPVLWPPNHNLVDVGLTYRVSDACDENPMVNVTVYADEDDEESTGDGHHSPDAKDDGSSLRLRSERKGDDDGRVYLIIVSSMDQSGNVGSHCCTVVVPHSPNSGGVASVEAQATAAQAVCELTGSPPPGYYLVGDGELIGPKQ